MPLIFLGAAALVWLATRPKETQEEETPVKDDYDGEPIGV